MELDLSAVDVGIGMALGLLLLLLSAFFSGSETALFSLPRERLLELREAHGSSARLIHLLERNPLGLLVTLLFGNLVVNVLFFCFTAASAHRLGLAYGVGWQAGLNGMALFMLILCGEIIPKALSMSDPLRILRITALPLRYWHYFMGPLRLCLEALTTRMTLRKESSIELRVDELQMLIDLTQADSAFGVQEKAIVEEMIKLPEVRIRETMVPRVEQTFWNGAWTLAEALRFAADHPMELIPVYLEQEEQMIGYVEMHQLYATAERELLLRSIV